MANAFSTKGATTTKPKSALEGQYIGNAIGRNPSMTPQARALQSVSSGALAGSRPPTFTPPKDQAIKSYKAPDGSVQTYYPTNSAKASYSGGEKLPAVGSAEYRASQALNTGTPQTGMVSPSTTGTTQAPQTPTRPTYGGLVGQLAQVSSQPSQQFTDLTKRAEEARIRAANFGAAVAQKEADMRTNPEYSLDTGVGLGNRIAQTEGVKATQLNATAAGLENLAGLANTQQSLQQSGLGTAAGLMQPQQVSYSNQFLDPTTGLPINPQAGQDMQSAIALQVQKLRSGATDPATAREALSAYGQAGINALEQQLGAGFNPNVASANQGSASELTTLKNNLQSTFNGVEANYELLLNTVKQGGINDQNIPVINAIQNKLGRGLASDPAVINFRNTLAAVRAGYAQILGGGTTTVDSQNRAQEAIPDDISLAALESLGQQLQSESINRIQGINQQINSITNQQSNQSTGSLFSW